MHRLIPVVCLLIASAPMAAQSQEGEAERGGAPDLGAFLDLSDLQIESLQEALLDLQDLVRPVAERQIESRQALEEELNSAAPNPLTVGDLVIEIHQAGEEINEIKLASRPDSVSVLTPEQQEKLVPLRIAAVLHRAAKQALSVNLIGPGDQPPGREEGE